MVVFSRESTSLPVPSVRLEVSRAKRRAEFSLFPLFDFRIALSLTIRTPQTGYLLRAHSFHITRKQSKEEKKI